MSIVFKLISYFTIFSFHFWASSWSRGAESSYAQLSPLFQNQCSTALLIDRISISKDEAEKILERLLKREDLTTNKVAACFKRADLISEYLASRNIYSEKIWIIGEGEDIRDPTHPTELWKLHAAVVVFIEEEPKKLKRFVLDPYISSLLLTVDEWIQSVRVKEAKSRLGYAPWPLPDGLIKDGRAVVTYSPASVFLVSVNYKGVVTLRTERDYLKESHH